VASLRNLIAVVPRVVAVVRPGADALAEALRSGGADVTVCKEADEGMGRTLAHAVRHAGEAGGYVVALADMPFIRPETIGRVAQAIVDGARIAAPSYRGERGHPVGFSPALREELQSAGGDAGARETLRRRPAELTAFDVDDPGVLRDVDTLEQIPQRGG